MEEAALYRAILGAPHDDTPRLVYADWLDENAGALPGALARAERGRAELIRLQCESARLMSWDGWRAAPRPFAPPLDGWRAAPRPFAPARGRERRLFFHHGHKWRRAYPTLIASSPFDRGFLRPCVALRPPEFLGHPSLHAPARLLTPLPADSPLRRCLPECGNLLLACPLWDVHLFASTWDADPHADRGLYADPLAQVGRHPLLERVGWLKVSFFTTPVYEFLRAGHFANVETLVLNAGPFPEVLEAVAENESFRSLRYVQFGHELWSWAPDYPARLRYRALEPKIREANHRHLPFGEMRAALRAILRETPVVPAEPPPAPPPPPVRPRRASAPAGADSAGRFVGSLLVFVVLLTLRLVFPGNRDREPVQSSTLPVRVDSNLPRYQPPPIPTVGEKLMDRWNPKGTPPQPAEFKAWLESLRKPVPGAPAPHPKRNDLVGPPDPAKPND